jgi:hypothetical protein
VDRRSLTAFRATLLLLAATACSFLPTAAGAQTTDSSPPAEDMAVDDLDLDGTAGLDEFSLEPAEPAEPAGARRMHFVVRGGASHQFDTGLDTAGDFNVTRGSAGAGVHTALGERLSLNVAGLYSVACYDFEQSGTFAFGEPWSDIHTTRVTAIFNYVLDQRWSVFSGPMGSVAAEGGADWSSAVTGGGLAGVGYRASDRVALRLGVAVNSELEEVVSVSPVLLVEWSLDDRWKLTGGGLDAGTTDAVGLAIAYQIDERYSVAARTGFVSNRFRLDDSALGFSPEGVGQDDRTMASVALILAPRPDLRINLVLGVALGGEIRIEDDQGDRVFQQDYDPAAYGGVSLLWRR